MSSMLPVTQSKINVAAQEGTLTTSSVFGDPQLLARVRDWLVSNKKGDDRLLAGLEAIRNLRYSASAGTLEDPMMAALELYRSYLMCGGDNEMSLETSLRFEVLDRIDQGLSIDEVSCIVYTQNGLIRPNNIARDGEA